MDPPTQWVSFSIARTFSKTLYTLPRDDRIFHPANDASVLYLYPSSTLALKSPPRILLWPAPSSRSTTSPVPISRSISS